MSLFRLLLAGGGSSQTSVLTDDPLYDKVTILLQGNGSNGGTQILDQINGTWTVVGNTQTDGSGAISFDGSGDYTYKAISNAIGTGDFTVDGKFRVASLASDRELFAISASNHDLNNFNLVMETKTTGAIRCSIQTGTSGGVNVDISSSAGVISAGVDYTMSFDVEGTAARIRINGAVVASGTITGTRANNQTECRIGALSPVSGFPRYHSGKTYWWRVTKGTVRNSGSGTVTAPSDPVPALSFPIYTSHWSAGTSADIQGVTTDGTHVWVSSSSTLYKRDKTGTLVTSRNVSGDAPLAKDQINGLFYYGGTLYVCAADYDSGSSTGTTWVVEYDPDTLAYITHHTITGNWFGEGLAFKDGYLWIVFHANMTVAKIDTSTWTVANTYSLPYSITGSSGGYGSGQGYDGVAWYGNYLLCNIHEVYNENFCDVYYFNGTTFDKVCRWPQPTSIATQGIAVDPSESGVVWFCERSVSGDFVAKVTLT